MQQLQLDTAAPPEKLVGAVGPGGKRGGRGYAAR